MGSALVIFNVMATIINVCAAVVSVTFATQSFFAMRRMERQRRKMWGQR